MYFCNAEFSISCYYVLHLWLCQDGRGRVSWRVSGEWVLRGWRQSSYNVVTGLEEDWTMALIDGSGTVSGSAWEALALAVPLLRLPLFLGHTEYTTLCEEGRPESPPGMAASSKYRISDLEEPLGSAWEWEALCSWACLRALFRTVRLTRGQCFMWVSSWESVLTLIL